MPWPEDMFAIEDAGAVDPAASPWGWVPSDWTQQQALPQPAPAPGAIDAGGVPAAAIHAVDPKAQTKQEQPAAAPPYAIVTAEDELPALPPVIEEPGAAPIEPSTALGASADGTDLSLPSMQPAMPDGEPGEIEMEPEYVGDPLENPDPDAAIDHLTGLSGEGFAKAQGKHAAARDEILATRLLEEATRNRERLELNEKARLEGVKRAEKAGREVEAEAAELSKQKLDNGRWWSNRSTPQKIAGFIAAIVGGMMQSRKGGANEGLAFIEREIDRDIEEQKFNLAQRKDDLKRRQGVVADMYARTGDEYRAAETARIGAWGAVVNQLQAEARNYDPRSSTAFRIAGDIREARAKHGELLLKYTAEEAKRQAELEKVKLENEKFEETKRKNRADEKIAAWGRANEAKRIKLDEKQGEAKLALDEKKLDVEVAKLEREGKKAEAAELRELGIGGLPSVATDENGKVVVGSDGAPKMTPTAALRHADGRIYKAPNPVVAEEMRKKIDAAREINEIISEILDIRDRVGGESDTFNSDEAQRLKVLKERAVVVAKAGTQGMSSDGDMKRIEDALGVADVKSFRARAAGLEEGRKQVNRSLDTYLRTRNYDGPTVEIKTARDFPKPAASKEETEYKAAITKPSVSATEAGAEAMKLAKAEADRRLKMGTLPPAKTGDTREDTARELMSPEAQRKHDYTHFVTSEAKKLAEGHKDISPSQRATLEKLGQAMKYGKTPEEKQRARDFLLNAADNAATEAQKTKARQLLQLYGGE